MASNDILKEIWKVTQENSTEEINEDEFTTSLSKSIYKQLEKFSENKSNINNEFSRTLPIILKQAKINPESLGRKEGSSFNVSSNVIISAIKTVKYENQFIPGTKEYMEKESTQKSNLDLKNIVFTTAVINQMIDNYSSLSFEEKDKIWDNCLSLSDDEYDKLIDAAREYWRKKRDDARENNNEEEAMLYENADKALGAQLDIKVEETIKEKGFYEFLQKNGIDEKTFRQLPKEDQIEICERFKRRQIDELPKQYDKLKEDFSHIKSKEDLEKYLEENEAELYREYQEINNNSKGEIELNEIIRMLLIKTSKKLNNEIKAIIENPREKEQNSKKGMEQDDFSLSVIEENLEKFLKVKESKLDGENQDNKNDSEKKNIVANNHFEKGNILSAINKYKEYFQEFDEETLEEINELTPEEIIANFKDDFNTMLEEKKIDEETKIILDTFADNITSATKGILLDSQKREVFFEQMQSNFTNKTITDAEIAQLFERLSVDLQVAPFEPVIEGNEQQDIGFEDFTSLLQNSEVDSLYINGVEMMVDEGATRAAVEAQERGEDPEKAILEYYGKLEQEGTIQDDIYGMPEEVREELQSGDGQEKNENIVVIKKGKEEKVQVFRPVQFLKKTSMAYQQNERKQGTTLPEISIQYELLEELAKEKREGALEPIQEEDQRD